MAWLDGNQLGNLMNQLVNRRQILSAAALAAAASPLALVAEQPQEAKVFPELTDGKVAPHVRTAIRALKLAKKEIDHAREGTFGVYKKSAVEAIDAAIMQLTYASQAAESKVETDAAKAKQR